MYWLIYPTKCGWLHPTAATVGCVAEYYLENILGSKEKEERDKKKLKQVQHCALN